MRHPGAPAGGAGEAVGADPRAGATEGAEGGQERPGATLRPERLWALLAALAPYAQLASAAGLRALPVAGRDGQTGGGDPQAWVDAMHASGDADRARATWQQLDRVRGPYRVLLGWLAERSVCWDRPSVAAVARAYALDHGPLALREALPAAEEARVVATKTLAQMKALAQELARGPITTEVARAQVLVTQCTAEEVQRAAEEARATAVVDAWGRAALEAAVEAWEVAGKENEGGA